MKVLAGIVLYNPDIDRLNENLNAVLPQVSQLICIDNNSNNVKEIKALLSHYKEIKVIYNKKNKGIASALREIMMFAVNQCFDWVLTLDQDSVCQSNLMVEYQKYMQLSQVGILSCIVVDRNFKQDFDFDKNVKWKEVSDCITSGALMRVKAYQETDGYDAKMFIDYVDFEICYALKRRGWKVICINYQGLLHELGFGCNINLFGRRFILANESAIRHYYISRNRIYLLRKYPDYLSVIMTLLREIRDEIFILLYEDDKVEKIKSCWRGVVESNSFFKYEKRR